MTISCSNESVTQTKYSAEKLSEGIKTTQ